MPVIIPVISAVASTATAAYSAHQQNKAAKKARDFANEMATAEEQERQRLEEKYGLTPGELAREQRLFGIPEGEEEIKISEGLEEQQQKELTRRAGLTGEELLAEAGPQTRALIDKVAQRAGLTGEELLASEGEISQVLRDQILQEAQDPFKFYQDTLEPELEQVRTMVNQEANRRGVFGGLPEGGIRFEQLGRAGVELAIKSARERMTYRQQALSNASVLAERAIQLSKEARGEQATVASAGLSEKERARAELDTFLANLQNLTAQAKQRELQMGLAGTEVAAEGRAARNELFASTIGTEEAGRAQVAGAANQGLQSILGGMGGGGGSALASFGVDKLAGSQAEPKGLSYGLDQESADITSDDDYLKNTRLSTPTQNLKQRTGRFQFQ